MQSTKLWEELKCDTDNNNIAKLRKCISTSSPFFKGSRILCFYFYNTLTANVPMYLSLLFNLLAGCRLKIIVYKVV